MSSVLLNKLIEAIKSDAKLNEKGRDNEESQANRAGTTLDLSPLHFNSRQMKRVIDTLKQVSHSVSTLKLNSCGLNLKDFSYVADLLANDCKIRTLEIDNNPVGSRGLSRIFDALCANNTLKILNMSGCIERHATDWSSQEVESLTNFLEQNTTLEKLDLGKVRISQPHLQFILQKFKTCNSILSKWTIDVFPENVYNGEPDRDKLKLFLKGIKHVCARHKRKVKLQHWQQNSQRLRSRWNWMRVATLIACTRANTKHSRQLLDSCFYLSDHIMEFTTAAQARLVKIDKSVTQRNQHDRRGRRSRSRSKSKSKSRSRSGGFNTSSSRSRSRSDRSERSDGDDALTSRDNNSNNKTKRKKRKKRKKRNKHYTGDGDDYDEDNNNDDRISTESNDHLDEGDLAQSGALQNIAIAAELEAKLALATVKYDIDGNNENNNNLGDQKRGHFINRAKPEFIAPVQDGWFEGLREIDLDQFARTQFFKSTTKPVQPRNQEGVNQGYVQIG